MFFHRFPRLQNSLPPVNLSLTSKKLLLKKIYFIDKLVILTQLMLTVDTLFLLVIFVHAILFLPHFSLPLNFMCLGVRTCFWHSFRTISFPSVVSLLFVLSLWLVLKIIIIIKLVEKAGYWEVAKIAIKAQQKIMKLHIGILCVLFQVSWWSYTGSVTTSWERSKNMLPLSSSSRPRPSI